MEKRDVIPITGQSLKSVSRPAGIEAADKETGKVGLEVLPVLQGDAWPVLQASSDDLDPKMLQDFYEKILKVGSFPDGISKENLFVQTGICVRMQDKYVPSAGGLLVFGKKPQAFLSFAGIQLVCFKGEEPPGFMLDRKEVRGNIPSMIEEAEQFVVKNMQMKSEIAGLKRTDEPEYPLVAVREAVTNAIIHRDYSMQESSLRIFMFTNRIEIHSPGGLPGPVNLKNLEQSQFSRNRVIVESLLHVGSYIEKLGTGIRRMKYTMKMHGLSAPEFSDSGAEFIVTLYNQPPKILPEKAKPIFQNMPKFINKEQEQWIRKGWARSYDQFEKARGTAGEWVREMLQRMPPIPMKGIPLAGIVLLVLLVACSGMMKMIRPKKDVMSLYRAASVYHQGKQYENAIHAYRKFLDQSPFHAKAADAQYYAAGCLEMLGKDQEAVDAYQTVLKNYTTSERAGYAQYSIGKILLRQGHLDQAIEIFQELLTDYPRSPAILETLRDLAQAYEKTARYEEAIDAWQKALDFQEGLSGGMEFYQMAMSYMNLKQYDGARKIFREIIANPTSEMVWVRKAKDGLDALKHMEEKDERRIIQTETITARKAGALKVNFKTDEQVPVAGISSQVPGVLAKHGQDGEEGQEAFFDDVTHFLEKTKASLTTKDSL